MKYCLLFLFFLSLSTLSMAQTGKLKGTVSDQKGGKAQYVNVLIEGSAKGNQCPNGQGRNGDNDQAPSQQRQLVKEDMNDHTRNGKSADQNDQGKVTADTPNVKRIDTAEGEQDNDQSHASDKIVSLKGRDQRDANDEEQRH